jgi:hypothetical protein
MSILDFKGNVEGRVVDCLENYKITESHKSQISFLWCFSKCAFQRPSEEGCYE